MKPRIMLGALVALMSIAAAVVVGNAGADRGKGHGRPSYEVWLIDQDDKFQETGPGVLHIFDGRELTRDAANAVPESIDLGGEVSTFCRERTGTAPVRPHMLVFNGGDNDGPGSKGKRRRGGRGGSKGERRRSHRRGPGRLQSPAARRGSQSRPARRGPRGPRRPTPRQPGNTHAVIAYVGSGHVAFLDAATREPVGCIDVGVQAHAAWPTPDQSALIVANQNGKLLHRIRTDYESNEFTLDEDATIDLAACTTPSGAPCEDPALRPDNAPICPRTTNDGAFTFVTLRGGGLFVVDHNATPMQIVAEYDREAVDDNGCGEMEANGKMYVNSGAGLTVPPVPGDDPFGHDVYAFDLDGFSTTPSTTPNTPPAKLVYTRDGTGAEVDAHAVALTKRGRYLWWGDRSANDVTVVNPRTDRVVNRFSLAGRVSDDPAPDLFDLSPDGRYVFASLRGPNPASGHEAYGSTPGVGVIRVRGGGRKGRLTGVARVGSVRGTPDPHAIRVRTLR